MASFKIEDFSFTYPNSDKLTLNKINLDVKQGEFLLIAGASGSGKTTLLRHLKTVLAPNGKKTGKILFNNKLLENVDQRVQTAKIGYVMQDPENQIITDKVWHELAYGLESLGYDNLTIRLRVAEMSAFFKITDWFYQDVSTLSGGQKQLLNLAAIMTMQPEVLILDEPTSQLDPIAASDFLLTLNKINKELGTTIILSEHHLEEALPLSDKVVIMDQGKVIVNTSPNKVGQKLKALAHPMFLAMPSPMRIVSDVDLKANSPLTIRDGRLWLDNLIASGHKLKAIKSIDNKVVNDPVIEVKDLWFKYDKDLPDVLKGLSLKVNRGEFLAIMGSNASGKSTTLKLLSGIESAYRGNVYINHKDIRSLSNFERYNNLLGVLPQDPTALFVKDTVISDLYEMLDNKDLSDNEKEAKLKKVIYLCNLKDLLNSHPYDLSGGEKQRAALAKVLLLEPTILLLDEPTKGLDASFKAEFSSIINNLRNNGLTVIMVSHDVEFIAEYASRCALLFDGSIISEGSPKDFFAHNSFYTTAANKMSRHIIKDAITVSDVLLALGYSTNKPKSHISDSAIYDIKLSNKNSEIKLKWYQRPKTSLISIITMIVIGYLAYPLLFDLVALNKSFKLTFSNLLLIIGFISALTVFIKSIITLPKDQINKVIVKKPKLSVRTKLSSLLILLLIPLTIYFGMVYLNDRKYYFISLLILIEVMLPFVLIFEDRSPQARELVIISVLVAIAIAGRAAFFMIPQFKPVGAIVIIAGVAFGAETGFLVGAMSMFLSNILYGQGPLTPWQMFAMGLIGFIAGLLYNKGFLSRDKLSLSIFGGILVFLVYGLIMNPASILIFQTNINFKMIVSAMILGLPFDLVHGIATFFFLYVIGDLMLEKLDRIKVKYGLLKS